MKCYLFSLNGEEAVIISVNALTVIARSALELFVQRERPVASTIRCCYRNRLVYYRPLAGDVLCGIVTVRYLNHGVFKTIERIGRFGVLNVQ